MIDSVDVVVSSDDVKALHYLGGLDYDFSPDHLYTINGRRPEFSIDHRTNAPVVQSAAAAADCSIGQPTRDVTDNGTESS